MQRDSCGIFTIFRCCSFRSCPSLLHYRSEKQRSTGFPEGHCCSAFPRCACCCLCSQTISRVDFSFSRRTAGFGCKRNVFDRVSVCCRLGNYLRGCGTGDAACKMQVFVEKKIPACNNTDVFGCVCGSVCKRYTLDAGRRRRSDGGTMPFCGDIA